MFGCTFVEHGNPSATGNVISVAGQAGSFAAGLDYGYLYQEGPDNSVDVIDEDGGTLLFESQEGNGRVVYYSGPSNTYRAIHSTIIFGALKNDVNTKDELMDLYTDYLTELTGIEEYVVEQSELPLSISPNPMKRSTNISFALRKPCRVEIALYNTAGQRVRDIADEEYGEGVHELVWYAADEKGTKLPNGTYILRITADAYSVSKPIVILQ